MVKSKDFTIDAFKNLEARAPGASTSWRQWGDVLLRTSFYAQWAQNFAQSSQIRYCYIIDPK